MDHNQDFDLDGILDGLDTEAPTPAQDAPARDMTPFLRKIPVRLTLEVGGADISLAELCRIGPGSVVELDKAAGEPLDIKVNGTTIGRAEVVVSGDNYGLRVVELNDLQLDSLA
ncbi:flagellar motor switch protein FliN [Chromobacterium amazonense]|uniref:Flagellar motor switch protein FliN n=1 Tax=Chromobacterium amazonense TaxID=1382803 RepID=A0ABU8V2G4_9NEIS|nr:flagellar motor switch protein FliN [Chromobacterium amazonense]KIA81533.1 flagellar motor switch protein FliN [Chromobacterium piscinae]MBM2884306.1 flagellar motor switch protein FliN [Chromobacterium amazonense]MDE1711380.1 flagellar motor switch protein FliN [Chromobacterium amazonense]MDQ4541993.1 flagellar motor switch protein FliN [Chromobacterium amazonense]